MPTSIFQEIDTLHAQCAVMDKATRLGWLAGKRMRLYQLAVHVRATGEFMNDAERTYAHELLSIIQEVEGTKTVNELQNEEVNELRNEAIKGLG